jgi:hypothetical protein
LAAVIYCSPLTIYWQPLLEHIAISVLETQITVIYFNWHYSLARIFRELLSRDHENGRATGQPQGVGSEAYLNGTSHGPTPKDARKDGHTRGRSKLFMKYPG